MVSHHSRPQGERPTLFTLARTVGRVNHCSPRSSICKWNMQIGFLMAKKVWFVGIYFQKSVFSFLFSFISPLEKYSFDSTVTKYVSDQRWSNFICAAFGSKQQIANRIEWSWKVNRDVSGNRGLPVKRVRLQSRHLFLFTGGGNTVVSLIWVTVTVEVSLSALFMIYPTKWGNPHTHTHPRADFHPQYVGTQHDLSVRG